MSTEDTVNVAALRRVDPYVKRIVRSASQVALYKFNPEWEKTETEGALFLCERSGKPYYNIIIMNRLNVRNLIEPLTDAIEIQLNMPFLLYKNSQSKIFGIWFYDKDDCLGIASDVQRILNALRQRSVQQPFHPKHDSTAVHCNRKSNDIFILLNKAQQNVSSSAQTTAPAPAAPPLGCTSESVKDFFKKACNSSSSKSIPSAKTIMIKPKFEIPQSSSNKNASPVALSSLFQQLTTTKDNREIKNQQQTKSTLKMPESLNSHAATTSTSLSALFANKTKNVAELDIKPPRSSADDQHFLMTPTMFLNNERNEQFVDRFDDNDDDERNDIDNVADVDDENDDHNNDDGHNDNHDHHNDENEHSRRQSYLHNFKVISANEDRTVSDSCRNSPLTSTAIEPLTLKQFQLAFIELLQNDRDFLKKLHESYYKSITNLIS